MTAGGGRTRGAAGLLLLLLLLVFVLGQGELQRFAVVSTATPDYIAANEQAIGSRRCYCLRHDYAFVRPR